MTEATGDQTVIADGMDNQTTTSTANWMDTVSQENRGSVERFKSVDELARGYGELNTALGSRVKIPDENSLPEERSAFYQKLGAPQNPEAYELGLSEDTPVSPQMISAIKQAAFESGVSQTQLQSVVKSYMDAEQAELHRSFEEGERSLKEEWGGQYDEKIAISQRALKELFDDDFINIIHQSPLGNSPIVIKNLHNVGLKMLDDTLVTGKVKSGEGAFEPKYLNSPNMYKDDDTEEGKKSRAYFEARGHKY
jgi:hypothetical protein